MEKIVGAKLWKTMVEIFGGWIDSDRFGHSLEGGHPEAGPPFTSVRELITVLMCDFGVESHKSGFDICSPLCQLLARPVNIQGNHFVPADQIAYSGLCFAHVPGLVRAAVEQVMWEDGEVGFKELLKSAGVKKLDELIRRIAPGFVTADLAHGLLPILHEKAGGRALRDFFIANTRTDGFWLWHPDIPSGIGVPLPPHNITTMHGTVTVEVANYKAEVPTDLVAAYEWNAALHQQPGATTPDAIATGMVYRAVRDAGFPLCSMSDLRWTADAASDTDVANMMAFLEQTPDAEELLVEGDLCFLWLWERKEGSQKGLGVECLLAALSDLKKRFRTLKTLVVFVRPGQFRAWGESVPAAIELEQQEAIENIELLLRVAQPEKSFKGNLRLASSKPMSFAEALLALGAADLVGD